MKFAVKFAKFAWISSEGKHQRPELPSLSLGSAREVHEVERARTSRWLLTYADTITLLLAFFVALLASSIVNQQQIVSVGQSIRAAFGSPPATSPVPRADPAFPSPLERSKSSSHRSLPQRTAEPGRD